MTLATHFAEKYGRENGREIKRISPKATALLTAYPWPGNIRELENVLERAALLCGPSGIIEAVHLPPAVQGAEGHGGAEEYPALSGTLDSVLDGMEKRMIIDSLAEYKGNMAKAAAKLGITERIMGLQMKKYGLSFKEFRKK
jgi:Nif-specific regulatory protein